MKRGRRDNGLDATSFVPLRDVDPRVGEHLLDVLYAAGIAAYLEPTSDVDSYTRAISLPSPPSDRLFVDRASRPTATSLVAEHASDAVATAGPSDAGRALEEAWAQIVAGYDRRPDTPVPPWPANEDTDDDHDDAADQDADGAADSRAESRRAHPSQTGRERSPEPEATGTDADTDADTDTDEPEDPEDHYVPPPPPPVPRLQQATLSALVVIAVGAMLLVAPGVLDLGADVSFVLGVLGIVAGVGMLVYRMHEKPPYDEDPDNGAVV